MERQDGLIWAGVGILFGIAFGAIIYLMARTRDLGLGLGMPLGAAPGSTPRVLSSLPPIPMIPPVPVVLTPARDAQIQPSRMNTYELPTTEGARVMTAGSDRHWRVQVRNIGPPGSIALIATNPSALAYPLTSLQVPSGAFADVRVEPRGALFAIGTVVGVQLTVTSSEELA